VRVSAVDNSYNESEPVDVEITVIDDEPPGAPTGLVVDDVRGRYVDVTWSPSPSLDVRVYEVTRASAGEAALTVAQTQAAQRGVRDSLAVSGTAYSYEVVAVDSAGNRSPPAAASLTFADPTPPPAPRYVGAVLTPTGVELSWERVVADDLAGYHVYRALVPTGVYERLTEAPIVELRFTDPTGEAEHYYSVRAVDRSANESTSSPAVRGRAP
jgi:fibronectin type 3 domain-containing protein